MASFRGRARFRADHPQVRAALVDDPLPVRADPRRADGVLLVIGQPQRCGDPTPSPRGDGFTPSPAGGGGWGEGLIDTLMNDVGAPRPAAVLADVEERPPIGAPHRRAVLAVEGRERALGGSVDVREPDLVVARAAIAAAIPRTLSADEGDLPAGRGEVRFLPLEEGQLALAASFDGNREALDVRREGGGSRRGEDDVLPIRRPARHHVGGAVEGEPARLAADRGRDVHVVLPVPVRAERDLLAVGAIDGVDVVGLVHGHRPGDAADGLDGPEIAEIAERDLLAVRRDIGRPREADRLLAFGRDRSQETGDRSQEDESQGADRGHEGKTLVTGCNRRTRKVGRYSSLLRAPGGAKGMTAESARFNSSLLPTTSCRPVFQTGRPV